MPGQTLHSIVKQFYSNISKVKLATKVITIEPAQNASTMEYAVNLSARLFSAAFGQVCVFREAQPDAPKRVCEHACAPQSSIQRQGCTIGKNGKYSGRLRFIQSLLL